MENRKLRQIVAKNRDTVYGRAHRFDTVKTLEDYQKQAPVTTYEDYLPYIEAIADGARNVLTKEPVLLFEPS
ncbi:MAG: GH3 auxin-responsive promoter family protein, partial [Clostridiales Family XIII bacterium]|nr:GH3 auxin-responsive promoter family protein [Clostridiales Family XIII bacterium]